MNTRSLKFRLVVWYAGWLTVLFIVFGFFVYASLSHHLKEALREALARRARQVVSIVQQPAVDWNTMGREIQTHFAPEANNRFTRVTVNGVVTYVAGPPSDRSFDPNTVPAAPPGKDGESFDRRLASDGTPLLIVVVSQTNNGIRYVAEEGSAEAPLTETLHAWLVALVVGLVVLISVAVIGGFLLVQQAVAPVDRITRSAERISSHNLSERLPVAQTRDELERLSTALNHMIHRLEESFQHNQRFLADASHELRTPLTIIHVELEAVMERQDITSEVRDLAGSALEEVERLRRIVEGLFALSRLDAGEGLEQSTLFDLSELAVTTTDQMGLLAVDKCISIHCHSADKIIIHGDRARLKQVIVNLLDNAIKYTPVGGKIDVSVTRQNGKAVLEVADNGIGISAEALPHLFQRFYRVDKARSRELGGAGLGLSIVKSICAAHHGKVEAQSRKGEGTRFIVELPA